ncbi:hypothetical protein KZX46_15755 [Polymorphobacter sp. PAMC 29334]|uniref:hypothetical protein n=1 Tax=Polymorphobacter sp. PAMC 29334 TaxID=2862331 RepID=UPI001C798E4A|nr:hypothetical protein [Polymorphobacter sp. PAMC 29334]QYE34222.1 hypothetical protein KZX46_15755 [Polymorphobacter sp. PAMC 29334]
MTDGGPVRDSRAVSLAAAGIMASGIAWRYWMIPRLHDSQYKLGEAFNVARSFAQHWTIADAFRIGQGPTSHLMPLPGVIAGTVYRWLGIFTPSSNLALTTIAMAFVFAGFWLLFISFRELGAPASGRLLALALLCWSPVNVLIEVIWFRVWDGGMAVAVGMAMLYAVLRVDRVERIGWRAVAGLSLLAAATLFVSPPFGVAGYLCALLLMVRRLPPRRWLATTAIASAAMVVVLAPWTIRNAVVMGSPIVLRDNFGLEFAQANDASLLSNADGDGGFHVRHLLIHPYPGASGYTAMVAAGGEIAYSQKLQHSALAWVETNPGGFVTLTLRHLGQILFPPYWMFPDFPNMGSIAERLAIHWFVTAEGLAGIGYALWRLDRRYRYAAIMTLVPILPYLIVQPILRYRYLIFGLLTFFAFDLIARVVARIASGFSLASAAEARTAPPAA